MLKNLTPYLALVGLKGNTASRPRDIKQTVAEIDAMRDSAQSLHKTLSEYKGGLLGAIPIGNKLRSGQQAAVKAAQNLDADPEPFSDAEVIEAMASYDAMVQAVLESLHTAVNKAAKFREAGVAGIAHNLVESLYADKNRFEEAYKRKLGEGEDRDISKPAEQVDSAFKAVCVALSS